MLPGFFDSVVALIIKTSTDLPPDVRAAMKHAVETEEPPSRAGQALNIISQNIDQAADIEGAICQDTGMPTFEVKTPVGANQIWMKKQIKEAIAEATKRGKLRPNSVDSLTGENSGNNLGPGTPVIHFEQWERDDIEVKLLLKGGGCENMNAQYSLPAELAHLGRADRTIEGVRKCILHAVWNAQGKGCAPGAIGVCIGGDRTSGYVEAKQQLFRSLDDVNPDPRLAELEAEIMRTANTLGVGPMGFGGKISLIGCKVGVQNRLPASFFVSVAYDCWAYRRLGVTLDGSTGAITQWLYRDPSVPTIPMMDQAGFKRTGREVALRAPIDEATIRSLKVGDVVLISGRAYTGRDAVHHHLVEPRAAGRSQRRRDLSLRSGGGEAAGRRLEGHRRGPDDEHSRGAVSGRHHRQIRRARGDRQGRHGREDARRAQAARRRVPQRYRRRGAVLRALHRAGGWGVAAGVWNSRGDVASTITGVPCNCDHGRPWKQPAQGFGAGIRRKT